MSSGMIEAEYTARESSALRDGCGSNAHLNPSISGIFRSRKIRSEADVRRDRQTRPAVQIADASTPLATSLARRKRAPSRSPSPQYVIWIVITTAVFIVVVCFRTGLTRLAAPARSNCLSRA